MKKIFIILMALMMSYGIANAQIATENAKFTDNTFVTVNVGVSTPMAFDKVFPLNTVAGVAAGKWFSPVWGAEIEASLWFGSHDAGNPFTHFDNEFGHNFVRSQYLGINGLLNFSNLFCGYKGTPRRFEVNGVLGVGWLHVYNPSGYADDFNGLASKTGLDFAFNLGKAKAHTFSIRPAVYWNHNRQGNMGYDGKADRFLRFNHKHAQVYLGLAYTYHFKTSNGTHHFKTYDIEAMQYEIARLNKELEAKPKEVIVEKVVTNEVQTTNAVATEPVVAQADVPSVDTFVFFAFDSDELSDEAKETLDEVKGPVCVVAYASPEGTEQYNKKLSQRRADVVKAYLEKKGVTVESAEGRGVRGKTSGRVAIVSVK